MNCIGKTNTGLVHLILNGFSLEKDKMLRNDIYLQSYVILQSCHHLFVSLFLFSDFKQIEETLSYLSLYSDPQAVLGAWQIFKK